MMTKEHKSLALLIGVGAVGAYFGGRYIANQAAEKATKAAQAVNPVNDENIFNRAFESVGAKITGNPNWSLGGAISDWVWKDEIEAANAPVNIGGSNGR